MDWLDLLTIQRTLKSLLQHHSSKASILWHSAFFTVQLEVISKAASTPTHPRCFLIPHHSSMLSCFLFQHPFREDSKICSEAFQVAVWIARSKPCFSNNDGKMFRDVLGAVLRCYRGALASVCSAKEARIPKCFLRAI